MGCNHLIINTDNLEVTDIRKDGGQLVGAAAAILISVFICHVISLLLGSNTIIEKLLKLLMSSTD